MKELKFSLIVFVWGFIQFVVLFRLAGALFSDILFFQGVWCLILSCLFLGLLLKLKFRQSLNFVLANSLIIFFFNLFLFTHAPVTYERSVSVFLMNQIGSQEGPASFQRLDQDFRSLYIAGDKALNKRLTEQSHIGNIEKTDGGYQLTSKGRMTLHSLRFVSSLFGVDLHYSKE